MMALAIQRLGFLLVGLCLVGSEAFSQYNPGFAGRPGSGSPVLNNINNGVRIPNNMSLVVSQTQDVHEQLVNLLQQLRRLQDLQVTTTVPYHTLSDSFFERNGLDFDFDIAGGRNFVGTQGGPTGNVFDPVTGEIVTNPFGTIQFRQGSYGATAPSFGNYDPATSGRTGFAVNKGRNAAYFFLEAGQGSNRSYTMQAPVVTLFNAQQAFISDSSQRPFVTSVIPVVGGNQRTLVPGWSQNPIITHIPNYGTNPYHMFSPYRPMPQYTSPIANILRRSKLEGRSLTVPPSASNRQVTAPRPKPSALAAGQSITGQSITGQSVSGHSIRGQSIAGRLSAAGYSSAGQPAPSVAQIRRLRDTERQADQSEARLHFQRGLEAEAAGKPGVAKTYYRLASQTATGDLKEKALERLQALTRSNYSPK